MIKVYKRVKGKPNTFREEQGFENINIFIAGGCYLSHIGYYEQISFTYKNVNHKVRLKKGKYGRYFYLNNNPYYVCDVSGLDEVVENDEL